MPPRATNLYQNLWRRKFFIIISNFYQFIKKYKELSGFFFKHICQLSCDSQVYRRTRCYNHCVASCNKNRVVAGQDDKHTDFRRLVSANRHDRNDKFTMSSTGIVSMTVIFFFRLKVSRFQQILTIYALRFEHVFRYRTDLHVQY